MNATTAKKTITNEDVWGVLQKLVGEVQGLTGKVQGLGGEVQGLVGEVQGLGGEVQDNSQNLSDFIAMTGKKFDKVDSRFDRIDNRMMSFEAQQLLIKTKLQSNDLRLAELKESVDTLLGEHKAYINDIGDVLDRITALEERMPNVTEQEIRELQTLLQSVVHWAIKAASAVDVPIRLPA